MRAILRLGLGFAGAALAAAASSARAQSADPNANNSSTTIGPAELKDFSIKGTVTTPAPTQDQAPTRPQTTRPRASAPAERPSVAPTATPSSNTERTPSPVSSAPARPAEAEPSRAAPTPTPTTHQATRSTAPSSSVTVALPKLDDGGRASADDNPAPPALSPSSGPSLLPWLFALLVAAAAGTYFIYQRRSQPAYAGDANFDIVEPVTVAKPLPRAMPAPPIPPAPAPRHDPVPAQPVTKPADEPLVGFVSTRLRPWLELEFRPIHCTVNDDKVVIEFEIEVENRGNAPARAVLIEARLVNAGENQDGEISNFFANPVGHGERIASIPPMKRIQLRSQLVATRDQVQVYEVGGKSVFVPLVAFNTLYEWARGEGQTSVSYLVGRDTKGDKLAPFRLDLGPRLFRTLDKRPLPIEVRH